MQPANTQLHSDVKRAGFTLVELSIVLVIIGLIIGGVLVGQDLIKAAERRSTIAQIDEYKAAINTFRNKYNGLPGDILNQDALEILPAGDPLKVAGMNPGDGDGVIGAVKSGSNEAFEVSYLWHNLYMTGMLKGDRACNSLIAAGNAGNGYFQGACFPLSKVAGKEAIGGWQKLGALGAFGIRYYPGGHYFQLMSAGGWGGPVNSGATAICGGAGTQPFCNGLTTSDAQAIDAKMDDGVPMSGVIRAFDASVMVWMGNTATFATTFNTPTEGAAGSSNCVNSGTTPKTYNVTNQDLYRCSLNIKAGF